MIYSSTTHQLVHITLIYPVAALAAQGVGYCRRFAYPYLRASYHQTMCQSCLYRQYVKNNYSRKLIIRISFNRKLDYLDFSSDCHVILQSTISKLYTRIEHKRDTLGAHGMLSNSKIDAWKIQISCGQRAPLLTIPGIYI